MSAPQKVPTHQIQVEYLTDHGPAKRTIFVYEGESLDLYLSKAWKDTALRATVHELAIEKTYKLKPTTTEGVWK